MSFCTIPEVATSERIQAAWKTGLTWPLDGALAVLAPGASTRLSLSRNLVRNQDCMYGSILGIPGGALPGWLSGLLYTWCAVSRAATLCHRGCNPTHPRCNPMPSGARCCSRCSSRPPPSPPAATTSASTASLLPRPSSSYSPQRRGTRTSRWR